MRLLFPFGGDKRDRTADLLNAIQALSQLSYTPVGLLTGGVPARCSIILAKRAGFVKSFFQRFCPPEHFPAPLVHFAAGR